MNITQWFEIIAFGVICVFDIVVCIIKRPTISRETNKWYYRLPAVPYGVGLVFIGHMLFGKFRIIPWPEWACILTFVTCSLAWLSWTIAMRVKPIQFSSRMFAWMCRRPWVPMILGTIVGGLFWRIH